LDKTTTSSNLHPYIKLAQTLYPSFKEWLF
jgi:hypothetical protein